ncbi:hypothetical protein LCGC14_1165740 [marine sediment metagenome]|uniref:Phospholipase C/D domain-containing protein n=1 Tax=marine sediment metagenome TaxID=412755 RepID=A0A0F9P9G6_9ZZZZ
MREITHKGLARLVGLYGSHAIDSDNLQILESSSVEPDEINREGLHKGMFEAIITSIGWFADHTDRAKELSIQNINKTSEAYNSGDQSWFRWLGWVFHFITDWATPYHSSNTMSKYILDSKSDIFNKESENGGVLFWTILDKLLNLVKFKADHDKFEDICEERWQQNDSIIKDNFIKFKENSISFVDLEIFSEKMDELRAKCENKLLDWITDCSNQEFSLYMTDIAKVMDVAFRIVLG